MKKIFLSLLFVAAASTFSSNAMEQTNRLNFQTEVSASDWDSLLDEYEELVDRLIPLIKKSKAGDPTAVMEYAKLAKNIVSLQSKLNDAKSDLTLAQAARLAKIGLKYAKAVQELQ